MKFDDDDKKYKSSCVCKISFKSVQVCGGCCKMFRGLLFWDTVYNTGSTDSKYSIQVVRLFYSGINVFYQVSNPIF